MTKFRTVSPVVWIGLTAELAEADLQRLAGTKRSITIWWDYFQDATSERQTWRSELALDPHEALNALIDAEANLKSKKR